MNKILSPLFALFRGTRRCPLSPLLFALVIEPLAEAICTDERIQGLCTKNTVNKISLYADDVLLYVTKPANSIPAIVNVIEQFGFFSGYRINLNKSELLPVGLKDLSQIYPTQFKMAKDSFTYLGIVITSKFRSLEEAKYAPLLEKLKRKIQFWKTPHFFDRQKKCY